MPGYRSPIPDTGSWAFKTAMGARVRWFRGADWHGLPPPCSVEVEAPDDDQGAAVVLDEPQDGAPEAIHAAR